MTACLRYVPVYGPVAVDSSGWTGAARSIIEYTGDCWFGFEVPRASVGVIVGLNQLNTGEHYLEIDHSFYFSRGKYRTIENGLLSEDEAVSYTEGDRFYIMRAGSEVGYFLRPVATAADAFFTDSRFPGLQLPGVVVGKSTNPSYSTAFLDISMFQLRDRIQNETTGIVWAPGELAGDGAALALPFSIATSEYDTWALLDVSFTASAGGSTTEGVTAELPFTVLGADTPLGSLIIGELPFTVTGEMSEEGNSVFPTMSGVTAFLPFSVEARGVDNSTRVEAELPFAVVAFGSSAGTALNDGANLNLPLNLFMTGSGGAAPAVTAGAFLELPFSAFGTGSDPTDVVITAGAALEVSFIVAATSSDDDDISPESWIIAELPFTMVGATSPSMGNYFNILLSFNAAVVVEPGPGEAIEITDGVVVSMQTLAQYVIMLRDFLNIVSTPQTFSTQAVELLETATVVAEAIPQFSLFIQEALSITDTISVAQAVEMADSLVAAGLVQTQYQAVVAVVSAVLVSDGTIGAFSKTVSDSITANDSLLAAIQLLALLTDSVGVAATLQNVLTITVLETAEMEVADTIALDAQYFQNMIDRVEVLAFIKTPAELAQGWVMNTEEAMPVSEYDNYTFNSLAYSPDEMLGCNDQGLYTLDGDDDAGTNIDAEIASLMLDFDTTKLKRMSTAYIGYTSTGTLLLKVRSVDQGLYAEDWYEGRNTGAQTPPGQNRMKIGKGLRSRYWTFELINIDGSDFELDKVELYPIVLDRRI